MCIHRLLKIHVFKNLLKTLTLGVNYAFLSVTRTYNNKSTKITSIFLMVIRKINITLLHSCISKILFNLF